MATTLIRPELVPVETKKGLLMANYYPGVGPEADQHEYDVVLMHGWLGAGTMDLWVAPYLSEHGINVSTTVRNNPHAYDFNLRDSMDLHAACRVHSMKSASKGSQEQKRPLIIIGHSMANIATSSVGIYSQKDESPYTIAAIISKAGVGYNDQPVGPGHISRHILPWIMKTTVQRDSANVTVRSVMNFMNNPPLAVARGLHAGRANLSQHKKLLEAADIQLFEWYGTDDRLILPPKNRSNFQTYSGDHMTPITEPELTLEALQTVIKLLSIQRPTAA